MKKIALMAVMLSGCDAIGDITGKDSAQNVVDPKELSGQPATGIGRFQIVPATGQYPPLIIDTATGCVSQIRLVGTEGQMQKISVNGEDTKRMKYDPASKELKEVPGGGLDRACSPEAVIQYDAQGHRLPAKSKPTVSNW